jgi:serine/threonine-protein kinase
MGEVWRAHDTGTDRIVAIKLLPAHFSDNEDFQRRFRREAHAAARLSTPHVIPIYDYGEIDGRLYVCMRLIEGRDLQAVLADGPLEPARAVRIIEHVAVALNAAHKVGLLHRDVKPSNILLDENDFAYLIDFGIARAADETRLTKSGNTIGTFAYIAPERLGTRAEEDARADIYSLACVLYECLTGSPPFAEDTMARLVAAHLSTPPPQPSTARPTVPAQIDQVIATGMAKDPDARYATTVELANAAHDAITAPIPRPTPSRAPAAPTEPESFPAASPPQAGVAAWSTTLQRPPGYQPQPQRPQPRPDQPAHQRMNGPAKVALIVGAVAVVASGVTTAVIHFNHASHPSASNQGGRHESVVASKVTATIPVGNSPLGVAVDPGTHAVYVTNAVANGTVSVIDPAVHTVTATIPVGKFPLSVAVDPATHTIYVANADIFPSTPDASTVSVIDPDTRTVTATIPVGNTPEGVVVDPSTHTLYTVNFGAYAVKVIDAASGTVTAQIRVGRGPVSVAIDPGANALYTTNILDNTVSVIDPATRTVTATIPVGNTPTSVAVDPVTHTVYVTNGSHTYVEGSDNTVSVIDAASRTVTATIRVGTDPTSVAVDPVTHTVYIANRGDNTVSVIDPATRTVTATIPVGYYPDGIAVDPGPHTVYVANGRENTVSVIEPEH